MNLMTWRLTCNSEFKKQMCKNKTNLRNLYKISKNGTTVELTNNIYKSFHTEYQWACKLC